MKTSRYLFVACVGGFLLSSCYKDKGDYVYNEDIHDISVKLESVYGMRKSDGIMTCNIDPEIETADGDKSYLEYVWIRYNEKSGVEDTVCKTERCTFELDPNASDFSYKYSLQLYVTDKHTNGVTMVPTSLEITKPYSYSWIVLHETDNHAEVGTVEYVGGKAMVIANAYTADRGESLTGKPVSLAVVKNSVDATNFKYQSVSQIYVTTTNLEESGLLNQTDHFKQMAPWNQLVHTSQANDIDFENMQFGMGDPGLVVTSNGNIFRNNYRSPFMFEMKVDPSLTGECYFDKCESGSTIGIAYDKKGHRFVMLNFSNNWRGYEQSSVASAGTISAIGNTAENAADPNKVPEDYNLIHFINGYRYELTNPGAILKYQVYAYCLSPDGQSHVYVFRYRPLLSTRYGASVPFFFSFKTPQGVTESTPMTSSYEYSNIIFYAVGNKIYKLDLATGESALIYSLEEQTDQIIDLKMAVEEYTDDASAFTGSSTYGHPYTRCLGAAVNTADGKGKIVVLQLNSAGKVEKEEKKWPNEQLYEGFGKIKAIDFI